jgi:hypothetical protein
MHFNSKKTLNLSKFMFRSLVKMTEKIWTLGKAHITNLFHHILIKIVVVHQLSAKKVTWKTFLEKLKTTPMEVGSSRKHVEFSKAPRPEVTKTYQIRLLSVTLERALSSLVGLDTKPKSWSVVTSVGLLLSLGSTGGVITHTNTNTIPYHTNTNTNTIPYQYHTIPYHTIPIPYQYQYQYHTNTIPLHTNNNTNTIPIPYHCIPIPIQLHTIAQQWYALAMICIPIPYQYQYHTIPYQYQYQHDTNQTIGIDSEP